MKITNIENNIFHILFEEKRLFGSNEYDLLVVMENNEVTQIIDGSVITSDGWHDIEEVTDINEFLIELNEMIKKNNN